MQGFLSLSTADLVDLAGAIRSGRLASPYPALAVQRFVSPAAAAAVVQDLQHLVNDGFQEDQIARMLELCVTDRRARPLVDDQLELVTTGPDVAGVTSRDTGVVVRELFANASESVLVAGYAIHQGRRVFEALADRMEALPSLNVRFFLDVQRSMGDTSAPMELVRRFEHRFRGQHWPLERRKPVVYYDPRSLDVGTGVRACLHAKCIVVDRREVFISSANFTEAAQDRNIEIGVLIRSTVMANQITSFFDTLLAKGALEQVSC